jgi:hypothetical protein
VVVGNGNFNHSHRLIVWSARLEYPASGRLV